MNLKSTNKFYNNSKFIINTIHTCTVSWPHTLIHRFILCCLYMIYTFTCIQWLFRYPSVSLKLCPRLDMGASIRNFHPLILTHNRIVCTLIDGQIGRWMDILEMFIVSMSECIQWKDHKDMCIYGFQCVEMHTISTGLHLSEFLRYSNNPGGKNIKLGPGSYQFASSS